MQRHSLNIIFLILIMSILAMPQVVYAFPPLPSSYFGLVSRNGIDMPEGSKVQAIINDQVYATTWVQIYEGNSVYSLTIPGDDPSTEVVEGGVQGDTIYFECDGILADQIAIWESGSNTDLALNFTVNDLDPTSTYTSTPTYTPSPTQTEEMPFNTPTPKHTKEPTATNQPIIAPSQTFTLIPTDVENEGLVTPSASETSQVPVVELSTPEKDQTSLKATKALIENPETFAPTVTESFNLIQNQPSIPFWVIGVPSIIIIGGVVGIWYFLRRSR